MNKHLHSYFSIIILSGLLLLSIGCQDPVGLEEKSYLVKEYPARIREKINDPMPHNPPIRGTIHQAAAADLKAQGQTNHQPMTVGKIEINESPEILNEMKALHATNFFDGENLSTNPPRYNATGKIDPFVPLMKKKETPKPKKAKRKKRLRRPREPLEKIDLSQLKLTGVIKTSQGNMAMVEETSGKGYVISTGTHIGMNSGKVIKILKNRIIVEEEIEGIDGEIELKKRELKLQRFSGEENYEQ